MNFFVKNVHKFFWVKNVHKFFVMYMRYAMKKGNVHK